MVVLDGTAVPAPQHYRAWADDLAAHGFSVMRTGALSVRQAHQAELAGLECVQELVLLEMGPPPRPASHLRRTRRLRTGQLDDIATVDRAAFGERWYLSASMLADVRTATPTHRARVVTGLTTAPVDGFIIAGRAARTGYVQRLAVHPDAQRRGVGQALLGDAVSWMRRARVHRVYVNTHVDNDAALALYRENGFRELPERLRVYEGPTTT